jgi:hypothetical protein
MTPDDLIYQQDVLLSIAESGEVRLNVGESVTGEGVGADAEMWGVDGFISMPDAPDPATGAATQALIFVDGQTKRVIATRNNRHNAKVGELKPGDRAIVSSSRARLLLKKETESITLFSETADGTSMLVTLDGVGERLLMAIGSSYFEMKDGEVTISCGAALLTMNADGVSVAGKHFAANTGTVGLATVAGASPPTGAMSAVVGVSGIAGVASSKVTIAI